MRKTCNLCQVEKDKELDFYKKYGRCKDCIKKLNMQKTKLKGLKNADEIDYNTDKFFKIGFRERIALFMEEIMKDINKIYTKKKLDK